MENNFMEILNGVKLYMDDGNSRLEEVNIPIEYFTEHEIMEEAVKNLMMRYGRNKILTTQKINTSKLNGFKIKNDSEERPYLELEYTMKYFHEPFRVQICDGHVENVGFKIKIETFLAEIDKILKERVAKMTEEKMPEVISNVNQILVRGEIKLSEYHEKVQEEISKILSSIPKSSHEYMLKKAEDFKKYYAYITGHDEYKKIFIEEKVITEIAQNQVGARREVSGRSANQRVNADISFGEREAVFSQYVTRKPILIYNRDNSEEVAYKGFVIDRKAEDGVIIVIEPIDGEKATFITFESYKDLQARKSLLDELDVNRSVYADIISDVLRKNKSEKSNDGKIITKYHIDKEVYMRNIKYMITGDEEIIKGAIHMSRLRDSRDNMIRSSRGVEK